MSAEQDVERCTCGQPLAVELGNPCSINKTAATTMVGWVPWVEWQREHRARLEAERKLENAVKIIKRLEGN